MKQQGFEYNIVGYDSWVKPVQFENTVAREKTDVHWLLSDNQLIMKKSKVASFYHYAVKVNLESGLKTASEFSIYFQPDFQTLDINFLKRHRSGEVKDITDAADIRLLQREESYSQGIYDGGVTALVILNDVQVGDIIEYAYTVRGRNPIFGQEYFASFPTNWSISVDRTYIRFITDKKLHHQVHGVEKSLLEIENHGDEFSYIWDQTSGQPIYDEGEYPYWYNPYGVIRFSQYDSWQGVIDWAIDLYKIPQIKNKKLIQLSQKWAKESKTKKQYAEKVIRYAQNNIRYFGIEIGQNSHRPYNPDVVFERKFGDCKDKAMFINTLLSMQDIEAYPALVSSRTGKAVKDRIPQPGSFDHVISTFIIEGKTYWVDGTRQLQYGSLDNIGVSDYQYALVIKSESDSLTRMDNESKVGSIAIREVINSENYNDSVKMSVIFDYRYSQAENTRSRLAADGLTNLSKGYKNYFSRQYPKIELLGNATVNDDDINNSIQVKVEFLIPDFWQTDTSNYEIALYGDLISSYIEKPQVADRSMPLATYYPIRLEHSIEINYNNSFKWQLDDTDITIESDTIKYQRKIEPQKKGIKIVHSFNTKKDYVTANKIVEHIDKSNQIREAIYYGVTIPRIDTNNDPVSNLRNSIRNLLKKNRQ